MIVTIRPYRESDRATLRELTIDAFNGVSIDHAIDNVIGPLAASTWRERKGRHVDHDIDFPFSELAVLDVEGEPVGYVSMRYDRTSLIGQIPNLAVSPAHRNQGLGRMLLQHALDRFRAEGMKIARIETLEQNSVGRHLYPSVGFKEVARQVHFAMNLDEPENPGPAGSTELPK